MGFATEEMNMAVQNVKSGGIPPSASQPAKTTESEQAQESGKSEKAAGPRRMAQAAYAKAAGEKPTISNAANVSISQQAKELSQASQQTKDINLAKKVMEETPDVREDKVQKYKDLIARGEYKPNIAGIADGMIREALLDDLASQPAPVEADAKAQVKSRT